MLASFFNKSKPINFLVVAIFMSIYYCAENYFMSEVPVTTAYFFKKMGLLLVYLLLMVLVNFIVKRNQVTKRNSFSIVLFALFTVSFSGILTNGDILIAGFFVLLALRRIISLKSGLAIKKKIFDASFWICTAALFYEWSLLFLVIVFMGVLFHAANDYRNWIVPILTALVVFVLYTCFHLLVWGSFFDVLYFFRPPNFDFSNYGDFHILFPLALMLTFSIWSIVDYFQAIGTATSAVKPSLLLILAIWAVSIFIVVLSPIKTGGELLFFIIPVSVIGANYFQRGKNSTFKEVLFIFLVVFTLLMPFLS